MNTAAGSLAASASEKQDEGTAADTHQVQPAVALHLARSAIASQAALFRAASAHAARAPRAESATKHHRSKQGIDERAMGGERGLKRARKGKKKPLSQRVLISRPYDFNSRELLMTELTVVRSTSELREISVPRLFPLT